MSDSLNKSDTANPAYAGMHELDTDKYGHYVDDLDLTEDQKNELLQTLWSLMCGFVDLGFGVDSVGRIFPELLASASETGEDPVELALDQHIQACDKAIQTDP